MERKSPFQFDLAALPPQVAAKGGTIQEANQGTFPALAGNGLAVYLLVLKPGAVRIPHWHPDAAELDYCLAGKARIGLGFPDGEWQRFDLTAGQISILPQGWFHYIQNVGEEDLRMLVQAIPKEVLAVTFGVPAERFDGLDLEVSDIAPQ